MNHWIEESIVSRCLLLSLVLVVSVASVSEAQEKKSPKKVLIQDLEKYFPSSLFHKTLAEPDIGGVKRQKRLELETLGQSKRGGKNYCLLMTDSVVVSRQGRSMKASVKTLFRISKKGYVVFNETTKKEELLYPFPIHEGQVFRRAKVSPEGFIHVRVQFSVVKSLKVGGKDYSNCLCVEEIVLDPSGAKSVKISHYAKGLGLIRVVGKVAGDIVFMELSDFQKGRRPRAAEPAKKPVTSFCTGCRESFRDGDRFCSHCGTKRK